jgi:hypothetical protein
MNNGALNEIVDRLEHLERENRRIRSLFKGALMLLLGVLGPVLYFGCQSRVNTIAAREIVLTDPQGHVRAKLSVSKAEGSTEFFPSLQFFDPSGQPNTSLSEAGLNFTYKESHAAFSFTGIEFHGRDDTHFLLSDLILSYSRGPKRVCRGTARRQRDFRYRQRERKPIWCHRRRRGCFYVRLLSERGRA